MQVRHVLYTVPEKIQAGEEVTIWYNPQDTPLRGKQQVRATGAGTERAKTRDERPVARTTAFASRGSEVPSPHATRASRLTSRQRRNVCCDVSRVRMPRRCT